MSDKERFRQRIILFYMKYNPQSLEKVDKALNSGMSEDELFANLSNKYNLPKLPSLTGQAKEDVRQRLVAFYQKYNPADMAKAEKALGRDSTEEELFDQLYTKYNVNLKDVVAEEQRKTSGGGAAAAGPASPGSPAGGGGSKKLCDLTGAEKQAAGKRIFDFYRTYNPSGMAKATKAFEYDMTEEELMEKLREKYPTPVQADGAASPGGAAAAPAAPKNLCDMQGAEKEACRARIHEFYETHNPTQMAKADKAFDYEMPESELMEKLREKYPTPVSTPRAGGSSEPKKLCDMQGAEKEAARGRIHAFYETNNPTQMAKADKAFDYDMTESELMEKLREKYPTPVSSPRAPAAPKNLCDMQGAEKEACRARIHEFYETHNPTQMAKADKAFDYEMPEAELMEKLREKYPTPVSTPRAGGSSEPKKLCDMQGAEKEAARGRIHAFYETNNPTQMAKADKAFDYDMTETELMEKLREKYPTPVSSPRAPAGPKNLCDLQGAEKEAARGRIVQFYEKYNPTQVAKADKAFDYEMTEDDLMEKLKEKYPTPVATSNSATLPPPSGGEAPSGGGTTLCDMKPAEKEATLTRVRDFYEKYNPRQFAKADKIFDYEMTEADLMEKLKEKYPNPADPLTLDQVDGPLKDRIRARIVAFYEEHKPSAVGKVDKVFATDLTEAELMERLREKYVNGTGTPSESSSRPPTPSQSSVAPLAESPVTQPVAPTPAPVAAPKEEEAPAPAPAPAPVVVTPATPEEEKESIKPEPAQPEPVPAPVAAPTPTPKVEEPTPAPAPVKQAPPRSKTPSPAAEEQAPPAATQPRQQQKKAPPPQRQEEPRQSSRGSRNPTPTQSRGGVSQSSASGPSSRNATPPSTSRRDQQREEAKKRAMQIMGSNSRSTSHQTQQPQQQQQQHSRQHLDANRNQYSRNQSAATASNSAQSGYSEQAYSEGTPSEDQYYEDEHQDHQHLHDGGGSTVAVSEMTEGYQHSRGSAQTNAGMMGTMIEQLQKDLVEANTRATQAELDRQRHAGQVQLLTMQLEAQRKLEQSVRQKEQLVREKDVALQARESAHQVGMSALSYAQQYRQDLAPTGALPPAAPSTSVQSHTHDYNSRLQEIEADLYKRCMGLQQAFETLNTRKVEVEKAEAMCKERLSKVVFVEKEAMERINHRDVEVGAKLAAIKPELTHLAAESKRLEAMEESVNAKLAESTRKEAQLVQGRADVAQREAAVKAQHQINEQEREVCRRLSEDVVRREGGVRAVEKSMNVARIELQRLEDDVSGRVRKLLDDEAAMKRWAADTDKKEAQVQSIVQQLREKGIHLNM